MDVYLGRQPIFGRRLEVRGYELLYRQGDVGSAQILEGDRATAQVLLTACTEIGLERVVGDRIAYINLTRSFILGRYPIPLRPEQVVLELLEGQCVDAELIAGVTALRSKGYRIALDDFDPDSGDAALLGHTDIVKLDCRALTPERLERAVHDLRARGLELLAEKVETQADFERCRALGFDAFQGYFLSRPKNLHARTLPPNVLALLRLLARLQDPDAEVEEVQTLVSQDVSLSYRLLRHINSASYALRQSLGSVREAVMYLGLAKVRNLASLFLLARLDGRPSELLVTAMLRARMCELLALERELARSDTYFTVGLFSALDALMECPLDVLLEHLPLAEPIRAALLAREGPLGEALACVLAYEVGDWESVRCANLSAERIRGAYLDAIAWVERTRMDAINQAA